MADRSDDHVELRSACGRGAWGTGQDHRYRDVAVSDPTPASAGARRRLPLPAIAAATVLALAAAVATFAFLDRQDGGEVARLGERSSGTLELVPTDGVDDDLLDVAFTWPDGSEGSLADVVDGPTVVNFFASWCTPCVREMPDFESVAQQLDGRVQVFGLAVQDRPEDAAGIVERTGITYGWARDVRGDLANAVGVTQMPTTMFLDADGEIVAIQAGALDEERLLELIEDALGVAP